MNKIRTSLFAGLAVAAIYAGQACATPVYEQVDHGEPPPPGWLLNLNGQSTHNTPLPHYVQYTVDFTAEHPTTHITVGLTDSTFDGFFFDNIAVTNLDNPGVNLIQNGGFEDGTAASGGNANAPVDWQYLNPYGVLEYPSIVECSYGYGAIGQGGSSCTWTPGFESAYDFITQPIATTVFDTYQVSFWALGPDEGKFWNGLDTVNDPTIEGNGFNIVVYAGTIPRPVPEPAAFGMFGFGVLLIGGFFSLRRWEQRHA